LIFCFQTKYEIQLYRCDRSHAFYHDGHGSNIRKKANKIFLNPAGVKGQYFKNTAVLKIRQMAYFFLNPND